MARAIAEVKLYGIYSAMQPYCYSDIYVVFV